MRKNIFAKQMQGTIDLDLLEVVMDFLSDRKIIVEVEGYRSAQRIVKLGSVQVSVLGPKLFNIYMKDVTNHTSGHRIIFYADDSYVVIPGNKKMRFTYASVII